MSAKLTNNCIKKKVKVTKYAEPVLIVSKISGGSVIEKSFLVADFIGDTIEELIGFIEVYYGKIKSIKHSKFRDLPTFSVETYPVTNSFTYKIQFKYLVVSDYRKYIG